MNKSIYNDIKYNQQLKFEKSFLVDIELPNLAKFHKHIIENIIIVRYNNSLAIGLWLQMLKLKYITCNIVQIN